MKKKRNVMSILKLDTNEILLKMKLFTLLMFAAFVSASASSYSQATKFNLSLKDVTIGDVFQNIEEKSEFVIIFNEKSLDINRKVDVVVNDETVDKILDQIFKGDKDAYRILDRQIAIYPNEIKKLPSNIKAESNNEQQKKEISGKVKDSKGIPMPGVSVVVKGTTSGTVTDSEGKFAISVPEDAKTLVFSFIGMKKQEIAMAEKTTFSIMMEEETVGIEEVVAVGYGTQKKRDLIGSISTINSDRFAKGSGSSNFTDLIQGQAAGVSVQSTSGVPGSESNILVRGLSSINASVTPLWIIDGIPIITNSGLNNAGTTDQSPMSLINPNDIESLEILKDAAATSIYGSRGSNGVILVTTKSGKSGKSSLNVDFSSGLSVLPFHKVKYLNTSQWFAINDEAAIANGQTAGFLMTDHYSKVPFSDVQLTRAQAEKINTNWFDEIMRQGEFHNLNVSAVGGNDKTNYYISGNYRDDNSVMKGNDLQRFTIRSNIDLKPLENLIVGIKMSLAISKNNRTKNTTNGESGGNTSGTSGGFEFLNSSAIPWYPVHNPNNPLQYYNAYTGMNPAATIDPANTLDVVNNYRILGGVYAEYSIPFVKGLKIRSELSLDFMQSNMNFWVSNIVRYNGSYASDQSLTQKNLNYNLYGTFKRSYGPHNISIVGGTEAQRNSQWNRLMQGQDLVGIYQELGTPNQRLYMYSGLGGENYLLAYFGRANYSFKDKYLAGISLRSDGSSTFTPEHRWGTFAAFSAGWIISDESYMSWIGKNNLLKIRGSFGQTGNQNIPSNLNVTGYNGNNPFASPDLSSLNGTSISTIGVSNLTWETTNNADIGLDFGFLNNKINGSLAYYHKLVKGLLLQAPIPLSVGLTGGNSIWENVGDLLNRGYEFNISSTNISKHDFVWKTNFNVTFNKNKVTKLLSTLDNNGMGMISGDEGQFITKKGYGIQEFLAAENAGVDSQTGFRMIYALDNTYYAQTGETRRLKAADGTYAKLVGNSNNIAGNMFHLKGKSALPTYYGGVFNSFEYKGFDLNIQVIFSGGNYILDYVRRRNVQPSYVGAIDKDVLGNYWEKPGDIKKYPRLDYYGVVTLPDGTTYSGFDSRTRLDTWAFRGDYVKLKNITIGYKFSKSICDKLKLQSIRIFGSVDNLYTLTKYPGWDPEGLQYVSTYSTPYNIPQQLTGTVGLSIKF